MKNLFLVILAVSFVVLTVEARRDQNREFKQEKRIRSGIKSKELSPGEAKKLNKGQIKIDQMQNKFKSDDGVVDANEKARLEHQQSKQSAYIYKMKHNEKKRGRIKNSSQTPAAPDQSQSTPPDDAGATE